jgi:hypothetical protein
MEVSCRKLRLPLYLGLNFPFSMHDEFEHLIIASAREHDLPGVKLEKSYGSGPNVNGLAELAPEHYFRCPIESADQVFGGRSLIKGEATSEIAKFNPLGVLSYHDVVRL